MGRLVQSTSEVQRILDEADGIRAFVTETVGNESQILRGEIQSLSEGVTERVLEQDEKINAATSALDATIEEQNDFLVEMQKELGEKLEEDVAELSRQIETSITESNQQITTRFNEQDALINAEFEKQNKEVAKVTTFDTKLTELSVECDELSTRLNVGCEGVLINITDKYYTPIQLSAPLKAGMIVESIADATGMYFRNKQGGETYYGADSFPLSLKEDIYVVIPSSNATGNMVVKSYVDSKMVVLDDRIATLNRESARVKSEVADIKGIEIPIYNSAEYQETMFGFDIKAGSILSEINISSDIGIYLSPSSGTDDFFVNKNQLPYTLQEDINGLRTRTAVDNGSIVFNGAIDDIQEEISNLERQISTLKSEVTTVTKIVTESGTEKNIRVDDIDWVNGITNSVTGQYDSSNTSYLTILSPIEVQENDVVKMYRSDNGVLPNAGDVIFYRQGALISSLSNPTFPVTVPENIDGVVINRTSPNDIGAYITLTRTETTLEPKMASEDDYGFMSKEDKQKLDSIVRVEIPELATPTDSGLMSASDKQKLDSIVLPIPKPVIEGSGMYKNASAYGVLPNNDGNTNADNYQAAVSGGGTIVIDIPGTYEFSKTIKIPSNTTLLFGANVYIKRVAGANGGVVGGYSFINENAYTGIYDNNIKIIGLNLIANGQDAGTTIQGLRSMLGFMHIKNLVVDGFQMRDGADEGKLIQNNYGIQVVDFQNISLTNIYIESYKDGIHLGIGKDFTIRDCKFRTHDDPIALNAMDYVASNAALGTIENGIIDNVHDLDFSGETEPRGRSILIYTGSWSEWKAGESYQYGDTVVSNGKIYRALSPAMGAEAIVAVNRPTHDSESVTTAEGIEWLMYQDFKVGYRADVKNVTISNLFVSQKRTAILSCDASNSSWNRATLSDEMSSIDNIILDKVYDLNGSDYAVAIYQDAELFRVSNSYFKNAGIQVSGFTNKTYKPAVISLVNNYFELEWGVVLNYSSSRVVKAKTSNTIVNGKLYFNDNVEVLDNR